MSTAALKKGESKLNIRPLHDRVIVRRLEEETRSPGGIVIPTPPRRSPSRGRWSPWARASCWKTAMCARST